MAVPTIIDGQVREGRARPRDLFEQLGPAVYRAAAEEGVNLSLYLEAQDPSSQYRDGLDAFERLMHVGGIRTCSNLAAGVYASEWGDFERSPQHRGLVPEYVARVWRATRFRGDPSTRALYASTDDLPGSSLRPYAEAAHVLPAPPTNPPIMLADLVALTTPITSNAYRAVYLTTSAAQSRMARVAEGAEIPRAKLTTASRTINLLKYGRALQATYESLRRTRVDKVAFWLRQLALQTEMDKVSQAIYVLVNGDGNSSTAADAWRAQTDFDSTATGKTLTLKAWWNFKLKFFPNFQLTHVLAAEGDVVKLGMVNLGSSSVPQYLLDTSMAPGYANTLRDGTRYGVTADVASDTLVGVDATQALERVTEVGSNISEIERWIVSQEQILTMTEVEAFAVLNQGATKTLLLES